MSNINKLINNFPISDIANPLQNLLRKYKKGEIDRNELLNQFINSAKNSIKIACNAIDSAEGRPLKPWDDD